jgi:prepilin-type N-terminal cleavage/methylation domain-containing protein
LKITKAARRAFSLTEFIVALSLVALLIAAVMWFFVFSVRSTGRATPQMALQQQSRKALVRFLRELQEGMLVVSPRTGTTLSYALVKDKVAVMRWYYQVRKPNGTNDLICYRHDTSAPDAQRTSVMLTGVKRLTFTCRSEGALDINLLLAEGDQEYATYTTVRLRNLASGEQLW